MGLSNARVGWALITRSPSPLLLCGMTPSARASPTSTSTCWGTVSEMTTHAPSVGSPCWQPGDTAVLRYITTHDGQPGTTWPGRIICDRDDLVALFIPRGTTYKNWLPHWAAPDRHLADAHWAGDIVRLLFPGRWHSVWVLLQAFDGTRRFRGYYVNFEEPFRRTTIGFDTNDHSLDIVVAPDLTWSWKDEDDFERRVRQGIYAEAFATEVRAEAARVIAAIEARATPFSDGWERFTPDPAWELPVLPTTWATEPVARWERWRWAYPSAQENR